MVAHVVPFPTAPQKRKNTANRGTNAPSRGASGRAGRRCLYCGAKLGANVKANYCSASHRVSMSRRKHRLCAWAMVAEYGYSIQTAERVLTACGMPEVERVMNLAGWHWEPARREWVKAESKGQVA